MVIALKQHYTQMASADRFCISTMSRTLANQNLPSHSSPLQPNYLLSFAGNKKDLQK